MYGHFRTVCIGIMILSATTRAGFAQSESARTLRDWSHVHRTIRESNGDEFFQRFGQLHKLSYLTTNQVTPSCSFVIDWDAKEKAEYSEWAKQQWLNWWTKSGAVIDQQRRLHSVPYPKAWKQAIELTKCNATIERVPKIWIPDEWTLYLYFKTGDYGGMEHEHWILHRSISDARVYRIKANVWNLRPLAVERCIDVDRDDLNEFLAVITYVYEYELRNPIQVVLPDQGSSSKTEYYCPNGLVRLDSHQNSIWYYEGYEHHEDPKLYSSKSRFLTTDDPELASDYELCDQKPGLARTIAMALWNDKKTWRRVFRLGREGRQLVRRTLYDPVFDKVDGDQERFAVLAASGDSKDEEVIASAILQAEKVESNQASYREMVTKEHFVTKENKQMLFASKNSWRVLLEYLHSARSSQPSILEDELMAVEATESTKFKLLRFDKSTTADARRTLSIPIGVE